MTIFGDWLRQRNRNIARAMTGDGRAAAQLEAQDEADPLGVDLEATRQALLVSIQAEERRRELDADRAQAILRWGCAAGHTLLDARVPHALAQKPFDGPDGARAWAYGHLSCGAPDAQRIAQVIEERKEQSIIAALVFGCSCGEPASTPEVLVCLRCNESRCDGVECSDDGAVASPWGPGDPARWLRSHAICAGLGSMVAWPREDA